MNVEQKQAKEREFIRPLIETEIVPSGVRESLIMQALQLRRDYREAFILCDIQGRSVAEAAFILGVHPITVASRLENARRQMSRSKDVGEG
jgi:DNA-directed RNA polymerase specialized sigma24 family protein